MLLTMLLAIAQQTPGNVAGPRFEISFPASGAEHCWNGDHTRANAYSRLRYAQMFIPRIMDQIRKNSPARADTTSWRY